jgi:hypothetical protein
MALPERLLQPSQGPEGKRQPQALGLETGQRDHAPAGRLVMAARASGAGGIGQPLQALAVKPMEPRPHPQGGEPHPSCHPRHGFPLGPGPHDVGALHQFARCAHKPGPIAGSKRVTM